MNKKLIYALGLLGFVTLSYAGSETNLPYDKTTLGKSAATTKELRFNNALGTGNPGLRGNSSTAKMEFSHDGTTWTAIGTGGTGGGNSGGAGVNLLVDSDNPDFEQCSGGSCTSWTASGGTVATETTSPFFATKSAKFTASASGQTFSSNAKSIPVGLQSKPCIGMISYKYAGSDGDYNLQIYDGTSTVGTPVSLLQATSVKNAYIGFQCPASGTILIRIISTVASPGTITLDGSASNGGLVFMGNNSITKSRIDGIAFGGNSAMTADCTSTPCTIAAQTGAWVTSVTRASLGRYTLNFASGHFSVPPLCTMMAIELGNSQYCSGKNAPTSVSSYDIICSSNTGGGSTQDGAVYIFCMEP